MAIPKITRAELKVCVHQDRQLPAGQLPEVAFLGRSNVGKSSLINTLLARKRLVRTSSRPGCTRALNFFLINEQWYFVDLPGYGYAQVSRETKARWGELILGYLEERRSLRALVFLQDPRRTPGPEELFLWEHLRAWNRAVIPVLTKADKVKKAERGKRLKEISAILAPFEVTPADFVWFSAATREGRDKLWARLLEYLI
ncbi:MAG: ribosome biogenesis GTP-binding protein YihA/YsxC [Thermodesulfobacteriota bacterium]